MHHQTIQTALDPKVNLDYDYSIVDDPWNNRYRTLYSTTKRSPSPVSMVYRLNTIDPVANDAILYLSLYGIWILDEY